MLTYPSDAINMLRRAGNVVIHHKNLSNYPAAQISVLCENGRKEKEFRATKWCSKHNYQTRQLTAAGLDNHLHRNCFTILHTIKCYYINAVGILLALFTRYPFNG